MDSTSGLHILQGRKAVLELEPLLQQLAERCDQSGAMHWLAYFLGGTGARWKHPYLVLLLEPGADSRFIRPEEVRGAALFYELRFFGIRTGAFCTDDWEGLRTVIAPAAIRGRLVAQAMQALLRNGAHVMLATCRYRSWQDRPASAMLEQPGILWAEYERELTKHRLVLEGTFEETIAKFGKKTRINLRYYRKRLLAKMDCMFLADALITVREDELMRMNIACLNPLSDEECRRRYRAMRELEGGFLIGLRNSEGQLLSVLGGWRQGSTTVMHHQMNIAGFEKDSLCTVMRAFFLESEIARGTRTIVFYHGTNHSMSRSFATDFVRDLVVRRRSLRARILLSLASRLASPRQYAETHYFGGSTTFFAAALAYGGAAWRSAMQQPGPLLIVPRAFPRSHKDAPTTLPSSTAPAPAGARRPEAS